MRKRYKTIDEYIGDFPENVGDRLEKIRQTVHEVARGAQETISYQMPAFQREGKILVYFAAFSDHISIILFLRKATISTKISPNTLQARGLCNFR